jgi:hypothetical protein
VSALKCNDAVILWEGAHDINRNNTNKALKNLSNFMNANKKINIILICSPLRHDLLLSSCVNNEVVKFNRQLKKTVKLHENVEFSEVELQRKDFTRHVQHLNYSGKELVSSELAKSVEQLFKEMKTAPIQIQWKDDNLDVFNLDIHSKIANVDKTDSDNKIKVSRRPRKAPVKRSKDFLW